MPKALTSIKVEGQEANKQFNEGGDTHEPKSTTTTTTVPKPHKFQSVSRVVNNSKVWLQIQMREY